MAGLKECQVREERSSRRSWSAATCEAVMSDMERTEKCFWTLEMCGLSIAEALQFHWYGGGRSQRAAVREERFKRWKYWYVDDLPISSIKKKVRGWVMSGGGGYRFKTGPFFF